MSVKRTLLIFAVLCVCTLAMVPKHRLVRAANNNGTKICAPETPCAWSLYITSSKEVYINVANTYCICGTAEHCVFAEEDQNIPGYVFKCKKQAT